MTKEWTKAEIQSLTTRELIAIVRSTNPRGSLYLELSWAREALERRYDRERFEEEACSA